MIGYDDNEGQMIFGDLGGLKLPDICLTGEENPRKNLICPNRGTNPGPLRDRRACYRLTHSGGREFGEVQNAQLAKSTLSLPSHWCHWDLFRSFKVCSYAKERVGCGKQRVAAAPIYP